VSSTITIGTAPDSRRVWFPSDPEQVLREVFLREVAEAPLLEAVVGLGRDIEGIIEHDLHSCPPALPLPIAKRTNAYLSTCTVEQPSSFGGSNE
jgi:hypothetical protein